MWWAATGSITLIIAWCRCASQIAAEWRKAVTEIEQMREEHAREIAALPNKPAANRSVIDVSDADAVA